MFKLTLLQVCCQVGCNGDGVGIFKHGDFGHLVLAMELSKRAFHVP